MGFFDALKNGISSFRDAVKAGSDFNPLLAEVEKEIESLHAQGKLNDVLYNAEQTYVKEHGEYEKNSVGAEAQKKEIAALAHFMEALKSADGIDPALKDKVSSLLDMRDKMENALGGLGKKLL